MSTITRGLILWFYIVATLVTFLGVLGLVLFEAHVRWTINQNFSILDGSAFAALVILLAAQMIGLVWLSRHH